MPVNSGYDATNLPADVLIDTGVLYINGNTPFGVTKGGLAFDPGVQRENIDFDGKLVDIEGLDRIIGWKSKITGKIIEYNAIKAAQLESGSSSATDAGTQVTTVTPKDGGALFVTGDYLTNARVAYQRGGGGFAIVEFAVAVVNTWKVGPGGNKAEIDIEIEARQAANATDLGVCPYVIKLAPTILAGA